MLDKITTFLTLYWPALIALGAFTTALNQFVQAIASRINAPWAARIANIVNTISVDYAKLLAEVGGAFNLGPRATKAASDVAKTGLVLLLVLATALPCGGCGSSLAGVPVLSVVDAAGRGAAQVFGWCKDNGIEPETVASGLKALEEKDWGTVHDMLERAVAAARAKGVPVPEETEVAFQLSREVLAAHAVEQGMRALSGRDEDGNPKP